MGLTYLIKLVRFLYLTAQMITFISPIMDVQNQPNEQNKIEILNYLN